MNAGSKWLGPGLVLGGVGAAMLCGAGLASADTGADTGRADRASHASASTSRSESTARTARSGPARVSTPKAAAARVNNKAPAASVASVDSVAPAASVARVAAPAAAAPVASPAAVAPKPVVASSEPIDPEQYAGTYYEQGSVKQFFSLGLVNTKAVYTVKPDGTLGVQNSGNYFFNRGLKSRITGSAVPVNSTNTALNVGFGGTPSANPPGNYLILDRAPDYSWVIVSDPSGRSGYILTRSKTIDPVTYAELVAKSRALGVTGRITPTRQFPA